MLSNLKYYWSCQSAYRTLPSAQFTSFTFCVSSRVSLQDHIPWNLVLVTQSHNVITFILKDIVPQRNGLNRVFLQFVIFCQILTESCQH